MTNKWYFSKEGRTVGPYDTEFARKFVRENPGVWCRRTSAADWELAYTVPEIRRVKKDGVTPFPPPPANLIDPKPSSPSGSDNNDLAAAGDVSQSAASQTHSTSVSNLSASTSSQGFGGSVVTEGIDYRIYGSEAQFVEVELDPGESVVAEAGAMMFKTPSVSFETIFGDGRQNEGGGLGSSLMGAGRRWLTGESLFTTVFTQTGAGKGRVAFGAPFPGTILPLDLSDFEGKLICQKDSFLAGLKGVSIGIHFQKRILTGLFGGEGFILQKLEGSGLVFIHAGGTLHKLELARGQSLQVDTGCLAAMTSSVDYAVESVGGIKSMIFGGEGFFLAKLQGPGTVWLQSLPFSRLAGRMLANSPVGGRSQGEGSLLGGLGDLFGDR